MRKIAFTLLIALTSVIAGAQVRSFSQDSAVFIKEVTDFVKETKIETAVKTSETFFEKWTKGAFNADMQKAIIRTANELLRKKGKAVPDFELYLGTLNAFHNSQLMTAKFKTWQAICDATMKDEKRDFIAFMEFSRGLFEENALYIASNKKWVADNNNFDFGFNKADPVVAFKKLKLSCITNGEQLHIYNTNGVFYPLKQTWYGKDGRTDWRRAGLDTNKVYAVYKKYQIDITKNEFSVDSAFFYHPDYFSAPVAGKLTDKAYPGTASRIDYPEFEAFNYEMKIDKFAGNEAKYLGGFGMRGDRVTARGSAEKPAKFEFLYKGKKTLLVESRLFIIDANSIMSDQTATTIYVDSGTIYHPRLNFTYNKKDKQVSLTRGSEGISQAPFFDDYHRLEILVDRMKWKLDLPAIEFDMNNPDAAAIFESANYFRDFRYEKVQGILEYNPIAHMYQYAVKTKNREFDLQTYADFWKSKKEYMVDQMIYLADRGYIYFDPETQKIYVKDKIYHYENSHFARIDYDVIRFESVIKGRDNASLSLINHNLTLQGVPSFIFSDSQQVQAIPTEQIVDIRKNRDLTFSGKILAGRFAFYSKKFDFDYNGFMLKNTNIDSMRIWYPDSTGSLRPIESVIEDLYGNLQIDKPNNKSGRKPSSEYPIFTSLRPSAVYYDKPGIQGGVYKRERFYFRVNPFTIDSLDNFTLAGLRFGGTMHSADIFPEFDHEVSIQPDFSLGFVHPTPPQVPMYKGKGRATMIMDLSNRGFYGAGEIEYLTSTTRSNRFLMLPDSTNAICESFDLPKSEVYPRVVGVGVYNHWVPYHDSMYVYSREQPLKMFDAAYNMKGNIVLTPKGVVGNGSVEWDEAEFYSKNMLFGPQKMSCDTGSIKIKAMDTTKVALYSSNVKGMVDLDKGVGDFKSNLPMMLSELPLNQYATTLNDFKWNMREKTILLKTNKPVGSDSAYFISRHPDQDSLRFASNNALFDLKTNLLTANKIPFIRVADAKVFPDSSKVTIEEKALMRTLNNSRIQADTITKYHNLFECSLNILSRQKLDGSGFYEYVDKQKRKQKLHFEKIGVNLEKHVIAEGTVSDTVNFTVATNIQFKGAARMLSTDKNLHFDGFMYPQYKMQPPYSRWFRYDAPVNPDSVVIAIDKTPKDEGLRELFTGFALGIDSHQLYPMLFSRKYNPRDIQIHSDSGIFYYDEAAGEFKMGDADKLLKGAPNGNIFTLNDKKGEARAEGSIDFALGYKSMEVKAAGTVTKMAADTFTTLDMMMTMDFKLPDKAYERLIKMVRDASEGMPPAKNDRPGVRNMLAELIDKGSQKEVFGELSAYGSIKLVPELRKMLFLSEVKLTYDPETKSLYSVSPVNLTAIGNNKIDKRFESRMQIEKKSSGDVVQVYIEITPNNWIYFNYTRDILYIITSEKELNDLLLTEAEKVNGENYQLRLATPRQRANFVKKFQE